MKRFLMMLIVLAGCNKNESLIEQREVVATVSGSPIYVDELERALKPFRGGPDDDEAGLPSQTSDEAQKRAILNMLIDRRLLVRAAEADNVVVGTDDVDAAYKRATSGWREADFDATLQQKDMTQAEMKGELRDLLLIRKYFNDHVFARVAVTDQEIEQYLEKNPTKNVAPEQVRARQIIVKTEEQARAVLAELKSGTSFEDAAMKHSISPEAKSGGDLGFFTHGEMPKVIDDACFSMSVGQTSGIVPSDYGFHIFKVVERRQAAPRPIERVRDDVETMLRKEKERQVEAQTLDELRKKAQITIREEQLARVI
jgi:peptidyl-prolyl cis-trans isomerase C